MSAPKPLGKTVLEAKEVTADRKKSGTYDQCGVGKLAVYVPSRFMPRKHYIAFGDLERVFRRVAVSPGSGKAFLTPVLYVVFVYDGGKEKQVYFKYLTDAEKLFAQLSKEHPNLPLVSEAEEQKQTQKKQEQEAVRSAQLNKEAEKAVIDLVNGQEILNMKPKLFKDLAQTAAAKRNMERINPFWQKVAIAICFAGLALFIAGIALVRSGSIQKSYALLMVIGGIAVIFMMVNTGILPAPKHTKKYADNEYKNALQAMKNSLTHAELFPVAAEYAHPYVLNRMENIIRSGKAENAEDAMKVLKDQLKAIDSSVALGRDEYKEIVTIKPLFLVNDYR